jgi:hypothetical protein
VRVTQEPADSTPQPRRSGYTLEVFVLMALGAMLVMSNARVTFIDDEVNVMNGAITPIRQVLKAFWSGPAPFDHPPLYDFSLHLWLQVTRGALDWLRLPSILFYLTGLFLLSRAAKRLAGADAARVVVWLGALWPYGFHYGRMTTDSPLCFLLIAGLTLAYLRLVERPGISRWCFALLVAIALVWTSYFGWAVIACLSFDYAWRKRGNLRRVAGLLCATALILAAAYVSLWRALLGAIKEIPHFGHSPLTMTLNGVFNFYTAFVSESVAPWFWKLGVPAALCVACCVAIVTCHAPRFTRQFWFYALVLFALLAVAGIINARRLLGVSAWLLLVVGVTLAAMPRGISRRLLMASLAGILFVGWLGIIERTYYAAPRLIEPWRQVADEAATRARFGQLVIGNNPSFFFYLTYALHVPQLPGNWRFAGVLPDTVTYPGVFEAGEWVEKGRPLEPYVYFVRGAPGPQHAGPAWDAEQWLRAHCERENEQLILPDPAAHLKARFFPEFGDLPWRIRVIEFHCPPAATVTH